MTQVTIYHNPRCSKSRETLTLLREHGVEPRIVQYLETPPDAKALRQLLRALGISARDLLRRKEDAYGQLGLDAPELSEDVLIDAMTRHPELIERPIVVVGDRARLGRPPVQVLEILP